MLIFKVVGEIPIEFTLPTICWVSDLNTTSHSLHFTTFARVFQRKLEQIFA